MSVHKWSPWNTTRLSKTTTGMAYYYQRDAIGSFCFCVASMCAHPLIKSSGWTYSDRMLLISDQVLTFCKGWRVLTFENYWFFTKIQLLAQMSASPVPDTSRSQTSSLRFAGDNRRKIRHGSWKLLNELHKLLHEWLVWCGNFVGWCDDQRLPRLWDVPLTYQLRTFCRRCPSNISAPTIKSLHELRRSLHELPVWSIL